MSQADIDAFVERVIAQKNKQITDEVFLLIQNDRIFMRDYLRLIEENNFNVVNMRIGKLVKTAYNLTNDQSRNDTPTSTLIKSFQEFE